MAIQGSAVLGPALKRLDVHSAREEDLAAAMSMLEFELPKNPWLERVPVLLAASVSNPGGEYRACVARRDGETVGVAVYGKVAGSPRTGVLYTVLVAPRSRRAGIGLKLLGFVASDLAASGSRMIFAEVPGDPQVMRYRALLIAYGFVEETRIEDYYSDGVPQIVSRLDL